MRPKVNKIRQIADKKPPRKVTFTKVSDIMKKMGEKEGIPDIDWRKVKLPDSQ